MRGSENAKPGDDVRVFDVNGASKGQPAGGWPGKIVKAGPKLVSVEYRGRVQVFRREGRANDSYGHQWFKTPEQADADERGWNARVLLRKHGIELTISSRLTVEQLEALAAVASTFTEEG